MQHWLIVHPELEAHLLRARRERATALRRLPRRVALRSTQVVRRLIDNVACCARALRCNIEYWHRQRQTRRQLLALTDSDLKDIGLTRGGIPFFADVFSRHCLK